MVYWWVSVAAFVVLACPPGLAQSRAAGLDLRGGWQAELYTLKTGERHVVTGLIVFTATEWGVTFFVTPDGQAPQRASAEGGTYTLDGTKLVLTHLYNFSTGGALPGLPASPMQMTVHGGTAPSLEQVTVSIDAERLTLAFPSGNTMVFRRSSRF
jgi:hypothetical protein